MFASMIPIYWLASLGHVLGNGRLRDCKAEPEQFALNLRRTPKHSLNAHLPDQCPLTRIDWWPASQVSRFPRMILWLRRTCASLTQPVTAR